MRRWWRVAGLAAVTFLAFGTVHSLAEDAGETKFEIPLGDVPRFTDEASAVAACQPDGVVWADRKTGFYYPKFYADYGTTKFGFYTCYKQAVKADYWSLTPASDGGHKGRTFPQFFCGACF